MSDGETNAFGKWTPIVAIVMAVGSGIFNAIDSNSGDKGGQEYTALNADAAFGVIGLVREGANQRADDLQRQLDQQQEEIDRLREELDRLE